MDPPTTQVLHTSVRADAIMDIMRAPSAYPEADADTQALAFEHVIEGLAPRSACPLFRLPFELYPQVLCELGSAELAALALIDPHSRQLARSRQFASIFFDYSPQSLFFLGHLASEIHQRDQGTAEGQQSSKPTIGVCVRSLTVATDKEWVGKVHRIDDASLAGIDANEEARRIKAATEHYYGQFLRLIGFLIARLPNLEHVDWHDVAPINAYSMACIAHSPIKHLTLRCARFDEDFEVDAPAPGSRPWALQKLQIHAGWSVSSNADHNSRRVGDVCMSIIRKAAPTLEVLRWTAARGAGVGQELTVKEAAGTAPIDFPHLRTLCIEGINLDDSALADAINRSNGTIQSFAALTSSESLLTSLAARGAVPKLTALHLQGCEQAKRGLELVHFISQNPQLTAFSIMDATEVSFLTFQLLPALSKSLSNITSLHLVWADFAIYPRALEVIGSMTTLEALWLAADANPAHIPEWIVDHEALRSGPLQNLKALQKLAFTKDVPKWVYDPDDETELPPVEDYYTHWRLPVGVEEEDLLRDAGEGMWGALPTPQGRAAQAAWAFEQGRRAAHAWEIWHRRAMVKEAEEWARVLPKLEWMWLGQTAVSLKAKGGAAPSSDGVEKEGLTVLNRLDELGSYLKRVWGFAFE